MKKSNCSITLYLSLTLMILLSFVFNIFEMVRLQCAKAFYQQCLVTALDSAFANYCKDLCDDFGLFFYYDETGGEGFEEDIELYLSKQINTDEFAAPLIASTFFPINNSEVDGLVAYSATDDNGFYFENEIVSYMKYCEVANIVGDLKDAVEKVKEGQDAEETKDSKIKEYENGSWEYMDPNAKEEADSLAGNSDFHAETTFDNNNSLNSVYETAAVAENEYAPNNNDLLTKAENNNYLPKNPDTETMALADNEITQRKTNKKTTVGDNAGAAAMESAAACEEGRKKASVALHEQPVVMAQSSVSEETETTPAPTYIDREKLDKNVEDDEKIKGYKELLKHPILALVAANKEVSKATYHSDFNLRPSANKTEGEYEYDDGLPETLARKALVGEYALTFLSSYTEPKDTQGLKYELEYLIAGKESDEDNLSTVVNWLMLIRSGLNTLYICNSENIKLAKAAATTICSFFPAPPLIAAVTALLVIAWAFAEAVVDVSDLLNGDEVPLIKSEESWNLSIENGIKKILEKIAPGNDKTEEVKEVKEKKHYSLGASGIALNYNGYLRLMLFIMSKETLCYRIMDMVQNRMSYKRASFNMEYCYYAANITATCDFPHVFLLSLKEKMRFDAHIDNKGNRFYLSRHY